MKKLLTIFVLSLVCVICAVGFAACNGVNDVGIKSVIINDDGDLIITLTDDKVTNVGKVHNEENPQGLDFRLKKDGTYEVYGCNAKLLENILLENIVIPTTYKSKAITSIGDTAFENCHGLASITIPDSVQIIGEYAFSGCRSLTSMTIGNSVTNIGNGAFGHCRSLTSITIPDSVQIIGEHAFYDCSSLTSIIIPDSVTSIGSYAFFGCSSLTSVTIGNSVTSIGNEAFGGCRSLTSIIIPDSVTSIGSYAFEFYSSLQYNEYNNGYYLGNNVNPYVIWIKAKNTSITSCTIHNDTKFICSQAFSDCSSLTSIIIPDSVTSIGNAAFYGCSSLTSVTIGNSVTSIGYEAFSYCSSLTSITIPDSVTSIGIYAFKGCNSLTSMTFNNINGWKVYTNNNMSDAIVIQSFQLEDTYAIAIFFANDGGNYYMKREVNIE